MTIFYFTSSGNSLYVAKTLSKNIISIPQALKQDITEYSDDVIGLVYPTYGHAAPAIIKEFISKVELKADYIFAIATCSHKLATATANLGVKVNYTSCVEMISNHIPMANIEDEKKQDKQIEKQLEQIQNDIDKRLVKITKPSVKNKIIVKAIATVHSGNPCKKFYLDDTCIGCKTCKKVCPGGNISVHGVPEFGNSCEGCLSCVHNCPKQAIKVKRDKNNNSRYRNENITMKKIIEANCIK